VPVPKCRDSGNRAPRQLVDHSNPRLPHRRKPSDSQVLRFAYASRRRRLLERRARASCGARAPPRPRARPSRRTRHPSWTRTISEAGLTLSGEAGSGRLAGTLSRLGTSGCAAVACTSAVALPTRASASASARLLVPHRRQAPTAARGLPHRNRVAELCRIVDLIALRNELRRLARPRSGFRFVAHGEVIDAENYELICIGRMAR
jgi:hypothetical protein